MQKVTPSSKLTKIKVKRLHPESQLPVSIYPDNAGYDLVAIDNGVTKDTYVEYSTGIAIEIERNWHVEIFPRSSITKTDLILANSVGIVDNNYRGLLICRFKIIPRQSCDPIMYKKGDRIAQLVLRKTENAEYTWADELSDTQRGDGGFGSTGS